MASDLKAKEITDQILNSHKFQKVDSDLIRQISEKEIQSSTKDKEVIKNVKSKLYQIGGAFREENINYSSFSEKLYSLREPVQQEELKEICMEIMQHHSSTRERLLVLDSFYQNIFSRLPEIYSIMDLACGLNPLAFPWMKTADNISYCAYDLYSDMSELLNAFFTKIKISGKASQMNLLTEFPEKKVQLTFLLKTIPCLEQVDKNAGFNILKQLQKITDYAVISFPVHSLSGKNKGMQKNYEAHFYEICSQDDWKIEKLDLSAELVFLLTNLQGIRTENL